MGSFGLEWGRKIFFCENLFFYYFLNYFFEHFLSEIYCSHSHRTTSTYYVWVISTWEIYWVGTYPCTHYSIIVLLFLTSNLNYVIMFNLELLYSYNLCFSWSWCYHIIFVYVHMTFDVRNTIFNVINFYKTVTFYFLLFRRKK